MINVTSDLAGTNRSYSTSAASGLQPIATNLSIANIYLRQKRPHACVIAKNSTLLNHCSMSKHRWHGGCLRDFPDVDLQSDGQECIRPIV